MATENVFGIEGGRSDYLTVISKHPTMCFVIDPEKAKLLPGILKRLQNGKAKITLSLEANRNDAYSAGGVPGFGMGFIDGSYIAYNVHGSPDSDEIFLKMFLRFPPDPNAPVNPSSSVTNAEVTYASLLLFAAPAQGYENHAHDVRGLPPGFSLEEIQFLIGLNDKEPLFSVRLCNENQ
jgi:hypothetical protein